MLTIQLTKKDSKKLNMAQTVVVEENLSYLSDEAVRQFVIGHFDLPPETSFEKYSVDRLGDKVLMYVKS